MQIWVLKSKVQECQNCGLKCHKKCIEYCMKQVPCHKKFYEDLKQTSEGDFAVYEHGEHSKEPSAANVHRHLAQQRGNIYAIIYTRSELTSLAHS